MATTLAASLTFAANLSSVGHRVNLPAKNSSVADVSLSIPDNPAGIVRFPCKYHETAGLRFVSKDAANVGVVPVVALVPLVWRRGGRAWECRKRDRRKATPIGPSRL